MALSRTTPLAVWLAEVDPASIIHAIIADVEFTHPNQIVIYAVWAYHLAIQYLLKNTADPQRARKAYEHTLYVLGLEKNEGTKTILKWLEFAEKLTTKGPNAINELKIRSENVSHIKHGFILSFYFLLRHNATQTIEG